jgi:hypothetical protein
MRGNITEIWIYDEILPRAIRSALIRADSSSSVKSIIRYNIVFCIYTSITDVKMIMMMSLHVFLSQLRD